MDRNRCTKQEESPKLLNCKNFYTVTYGIYAIAQQRGGGGGGGTVF